MAIPIEGHVQANSRPPCYYRYAVEVSNRTVSSVHIVLKVWLWMGNYTNYYSFRIAHECKVNGVYQYADIKTTRKFWGHQWAGNYYGGGDFYWNQNEYDYAGNAVHGPFVVFNGDVPVGVDDNVVSIIPCITSPPICGLGGTGIYAPNTQDVSNWAGEWGYWRPFGQDEYIGTFAYSGNHGDACWLNNRYLEPLASGCNIPQYPRPDDVRGLVLTPKTMDVSRQGIDPFSAQWSSSSRATSYQVRVKSSAPSKQAIIGSTRATRMDGIQPNRILSVSEFFDSATIQAGVQAFDGLGVGSKNIVWSGASKYYEIPSYSPDEAYLIGRKGTPDWVLYRGEDKTTTIHYSGESNGSYPIARYELVRLDDGAKLIWNASEAVNDRELGERLKQLSVPGVPQPRTWRTWELRVYNTKNRPVYLKNGKWLRLEVYYYGGILFVRDMEKWHEGVAWIFHDGKWRDSVSVYVHKNGEWKTL